MCCVAVVLFVSVSWCYGVCVSFNVYSSWCHTSNHCATVCVKVVVSVSTASHWSYSFTRASAVLMIGSISKGTINEPLDTAVTTWKIFDNRTTRNIKFKAL